MDIQEILATIDQLSEEQQDQIIQHLQQAKVRAKDKPKFQRVAGLGRGSVWMSEDFTSELPDEFWLGEA